MGWWGFCHVTVDLVRRPGQMNQGTGELERRGEERSDIYPPDMMNVLPSIFMFTAWVQLIYC